MRPTLTPQPIRAAVTLTAGTVKARATIPLVVVVVVVVVRTIIILVVIVVAVIKKEVALSATVIVVVVATLIIVTVAGLREPTSLVMALEGGLRDTSDKGYLLTWILE